MIEILEKFGFPIFVGVVSMAAIWSILWRFFVRHLKVIDKQDDAINAIVAAQISQAEATRDMKRNLAEMNETCKALHFQVKLLTKAE